MRKPELWLVCVEEKEGSTILDWAQRLPGDTKKNYRALRKIANGWRDREKFGGYTWAAPHGGAMSDCMIKRMIIGGNALYRCPAGEACTC